MLGYNGQGYDYRAFDTTLGSTSDEMRHALAGKFSIHLGLKIYALPSTSPANANIPTFGRSAGLLSLISSRAAAGPINFRLSNSVSAGTGTVTRSN